jgi:predicted GNAT family N-acyltransferase
MSSPTFRPYISDDLEAVVGVFRSNIPKYFRPEEEQGLRDFIEGEHAADYFVQMLEREIVGSGGIALNENQTVSLCWGMVRADHLGTGLGKKLTDFRIGLAREKFGGLPVVLTTSQHTEKFYEKYGFVTLDHTVDGHGPGIDLCRMRLDSPRQISILSIG